jgi:kynurenine formamidase
MKIIDLSVTLESDASWAPRYARNVVKHQTHAFGAWAMRWLFGVKRKHLRSGTGWAHDMLKMSTHGTTHVDAPWHYAPTCEGRPARTIDQLPLEWFHAPGVKLEMREHPEDRPLSVDDFQAALAKIGHVLTPGEIVLVQTGVDRLLGTPQYFHQGPGVSAASTRWLCDQGIRVMGIDAWSWEASLKRQAAEAVATDRNDLFWEAHYVGLDKEYCQIERLTNLAALPPHGFTISAFPLKVKRGSAGPARVVAIIND